MNDIIAITIKAINAIVNTISVKGVNQNIKATNSIAIFVFILYTIGYVNNRTIPVDKHPYINSNDKNNPNI